MRSTRPAVLFILLVTMTALLAGGCSSTPKKTNKKNKAVKVKSDGDGYLAGGPTVHLADTANREFATPLEALSATNQRLAAALERIRVLEEQNRKLDEERRYLEKARLDLESSLTEAELTLDREREIQSRMAQTLADLRIKTVELEQEVFGLKVEVLGKVPPPVADKTSEPGKAPEKSTSKSADPDDAADDGRENGTVASGG